MSEHNHVVLDPDYYHAIRIEKCYGSMSVTRRASIRCDCETAGDHHHIIIISEDGTGRHPAPVQSQAMVSRILEQDKCLEEGDAEKVMALPAVQELPVSFTNDEQVYLDKVKSGEINELFALHGV